MPESAPKSVGLRHALFLGRLGPDEPPTSREVRLGQGAFLVLRLLDLFAPERGQGDADAFRYQWTATERYCAELAGEGPEAGHLIGLVRIAAEAYRGGDVRLLAPGLLAYAQYLEDRAQYEEALDVLETLLEVGRLRLSTAERIAGGLQFARVNRKMARFEAAQAAYAEAGGLAVAAGDTHSALFGRIGTAECLRGQGNLPNAERTFREIILAAGAQDDHDALARAEHGLAAVLYHRGQPTEAIPHAWRAFELYEAPSSRLRALNDLGLMWLALGDASNAERALLYVVQHGGGQDQVNNALIELMHCASYKRDRVGFERWRTECEERAESMAPNMLADFYVKAGIGHARFGGFRKAGALLDEALAVASRHGLHEFEFKIERIAAGLHECEQEAQQPPLAPAESVVQTDALREVSASLAALGV